MNWPISSTLVNNSISTKRKETFPLLSSLILFFGQSFCSGSLDNSWGKWEADADLFLATKLSGQSAILATCAFWQTTISSKHFHYQREAIIITIMVCHFPRCFIHCCLHLFMVVSFISYKGIAHFLWFAIFHPFWWCFSSNIVTVHHLLQSYLVMHHFYYFAPFSTLHLLLYSV